MDGLDWRKKAKEATATGPVGDRSGHNTWVLVVFTTVTNLADGITKVALPLIATSLTSSPALVSGVLLSLTLPWLLIALPVGVLVDRVNRRSLIALANCARLVAVVGLLTAHGLGGITLPMLYGAGALLGVAEVVALTSASAIVPDAVAPAGRERVNTWMTAAETLANEFAGPAVGGLLMAVGAAVALGATTVGYVLGIAVLGLLFGRFRVERDPGRPELTVRQQVVEGIVFLWRQRLLRLLSLTVAVLITCWSAWLALMPLVATTSMGLSAGGYGLLVSSLGVGGLAGALLVSTANRFFGRRKVMFANVFFTCSMVAVPAVTTHVWAVGCAAFLGGLGGTLWTVNARTISQVLVHQEMMGRWSAANRLFSWGSIPLGTALAGALAQGIGPKATFGVFAVATAVVIVPFLRIFTPDVLKDLETRLEEAVATPV
ncbi:MFS transporter [Streptomyces prunicolor]|uniref:MFS transporter n=1 Tax=Streptomyces prunicolor TaxID=67348 RepID=A0ABU4FFL7_9ACTN|nr:MFS transporter [Streptomyces prunicolor]MDV7219374.1 MFS transporter [Streptomyces prunicolor]